MSTSPSHLTSDRSGSLTAFYHCILERDETTWAGDSETVLGYATGELPRTGTGRLALIHPDDRAAVEAALAGCCAGGRVQRLRYRARAQDGAWRPLVEEATSLSDGVLLGAVRPVDASIQDRLRFFDLGLDLFCVLSLDGVFLRINDHFGTLLGYLDKALLGRPFLALVHHDDRQTATFALDKLSRGASVGPFRTRYRGSRGAYHWIEWTAHSFAAEGKIFVLGRDIQETVEMEQELLARERREHDILNNTSAVVYVKGRDGRYQFVNQRFALLFEVDRGSVLGKTDQEVFPRETAEMFQKNDRHVLETRQTLTIQEVVPHDDGPHTYVSVKFPLLDGGGRVAAVAGISTDITDQLRAREADNQMHFARLFQQTLYPASAPDVPGLDIVGGALPVAQVCGDYYDYIRRQTGELVLAVGDVSGHGYGPALQMVEVRAVLRMLLRGNTDLETAARELNRLLCEDLPPSSFVSLFLAELDADRRHLCYIGAGHQAFLLPAAGGIEVLESTAHLMGIDEDATFEPAGPIPLELGDVLLVFTDGLTEVMNMAGDQFGGRRLGHAVRAHCHESAEGILRGLFAAVFAFGAGRTIQDDMTAIVAKVVE
jgi:PAS domain S-box-containing protein